MSEQLFEPRHILIVRTSAIGDVIMASPLISALRSKYPEAKISWLAEPFVHSLIEHHPELHRVFSFPKERFKALWRDRKFKTLFKELRVLIRQLKRQRFDLAIDAQGLLKSGIWLWLSKAERRVGFRSKEGSNWMMTELVEKPLGHPEISSEYRAMADYLGCDINSFSLEIAVPVKIHKQVQELLRSYSLYQFVVICPFTTRPQKHWFDENWRELALLFHQEMQWPVIVVGGPDDQSHAESICQGLPFMFHLCGETNLLQSVEVIHQAELVVGVDTGMTHAGIAMNTPTLALFGSTRPYLETGTDLAKVIYLNKSCSPCRRAPTCGGSFDCLADITPAMVLKEAHRLVSKTMPSKVG